MTSHTTQTTLVDLLISIKALPMDTIVDKLSLVMKRPPSTDHQTNAKVTSRVIIYLYLKNSICIAFGCISDDQLSNVIITRIVLSLNTFS